MMISYQLKKKLQDTFLIGAFVRMSTIEVDVFSSCNVTQLKYLCSSINILSKEQVGVLPYKQLCQYPSKGNNIKMFSVQCYLHVGIKVSCELMFPVFFFNPKIKTFSYLIIELGFCGMVQRSN